MRYIYWYTDTEKFNFENKKKVDLGKKKVDLGKKKFDLEKKSWQKRQLKKSSCIM